MSKKLKNIMKLPKEDRNTRLVEYLIELGGSPTGISYSRTGRIAEQEVINKIINLERINREEKLWVIALLSAIASIISALAAWFAVLK